MDMIPRRPENADTETQYFVFFPKGWHLSLCLRWLKLRKILVPLGDTDADVYGYDSLYCTNPNAVHGCWYSGGWERIRYCFKKLVNPRV